MTKKIDGQEVGNAAVPLIITVEKRDIARGKRQNENACAVAVAAVRQVRGCTAAKIHLGVLYLMINGTWRRWRTPSAMRTEIIVFDRGGAFQPDQYQFLPITTAALVRKVKNSSSTPKRRAPRWKRSKPHVLENVRNSAHGNDR